MIQVVTEHSLAIDSDDHHHPDGVHFDNRCNDQFVQSVEQYFHYNKINFLDLGCAGGGLVVGMYNSGHDAIGLEGSDHCINFKKEYVDKLGLPYGI